MLDNMAKHLPMSSNVVEPANKPNDALGQIIERIHAFCEAAPDVF
jgi:hypothetical protein